jgi:hypothetical protein
MGIKGLIRDAIMAYVAFQLLIGGMSNFQLAFYNNRFFNNEEWLDDG